jgi:hypothetical protein
MLRLSFNVSSDYELMLGKVEGTLMLDDQSSQYLFGRQYNMMHLISHFCTLVSITETAQENCFEKVTESGEEALESLQG